MQYNLYKTILLVILLLITFILYSFKSKSDEYYIPTPVVASDQDYSWYTLGNPNLAFAPAVHFKPPSRRDCLRFVKFNYKNPDEQYTKFIECLQNVSSKVRIKNLPISSPGVGGEEEFRYL